VLKVCSDILNATNQGLVTLLGLFDTSAAFDTVDHALLKESLHSGVGVGGALSWFTSSYLTGRSYRVKQVGFMSGQCDLVCGVQQGSVLGPLLSLIYTSNVEKLFARHGFQVHAYADDLQAYTSCLPSHQD